MKAYLPIVCFALAAPSLLGCFYLARGTTSGGSSAQAAPEPANEPAGGAASPTPAGGQAQSPPAPEFIPSSLEMHSDCSKTVPLFLGEKPKFGSGTKTSIGSNTTTTFPRHPDGTMTVWIIDDSENGISSAVASKTTKRITVGGDCRSLRAE